MQQSRGQKGQEVRSDPTRMDRPLLDCREGSEGSGSYSACGLDKNEIRTSQKQKLQSQGATSSFKAPGRVKKVL